MKRAPDAGECGDAASEGLCADCRFARRIVSAKGSSFLQCGRAKQDPAYRAYPPLPVTRCPGYDSVGSAEQQADSS